MEKKLWYSPVEIHTKAQRLVDGPESRNSGSEAAEMSILYSDRMQSDWGCHVHIESFRYSFNSYGTRSIIRFRNYLGEQIRFCNKDGDAYTFRVDNVDITWSMVPSDEPTI